MQAIPYIIMAAGTAASMSAQREAQKERRSILNRQMEADEKATDQSAALAQQEGQRFSGQARAEGLQQQEQKTFDQTQADLGGAGGANIAAAADSASVSQDFLKTKAARAIDEGTRLTTIAREAAKQRAPGMLQLEDGLSMAGLSGNLQNLWGTRRNIGRAAGMDAQNVQEPGYGALGRIASAVGGGMAASGYGSAVDTGAGISPPNPYATGPYAMKPAGINFGGR